MVKEPGLEVQVIVESESVIMVLSDPCHGRASIKELELKGFVEIIASEVELTADKGTGGTTVDKGGEYLGQAVESDIDDKQLHRPGAELQGSLGMVDYGLRVLGGGLFQHCRDLQSTAEFSILPQQPLP
ncbi:hypothetical protein H2248_007196 [Termitomyces sp. 'cryptogamus']|nr:hypothetical protein H2248_007196 [Termitomyces sp. 'cryptogamus']